MNAEEKKEWLRRYRRKKFLAESLWRQAREWQETIYEPSCKVIDGMPKAPSVSNLADKEIVRHLDMIEEATTATKEAHIIRMETIGKIRELDRLEHVKVLMFKYVEGLSWGQIKRRLSYSEPHVFRLHDEAINQLNL